jgi:hypothetical protein
VQSGRRFDLRANIFASSFAGMMVCGRIRTVAPRQQGLDHDGRFELDRRWVPVYIYETEGQPPETVSFDLNQSDRRVN